MPFVAIQTIVIACVGMRLPLGHAGLPSLGLGCQGLDKSLPRGV